MGGWGVSQAKKIENVLFKDRNIFSINVELTSPFLLYRGLVRHHHRILKVKNLKCFKKSPTPL